MGGSNSKESAASPVIPQSHAADLNDSRKTGGTVYEVKGAAHNIVVYDNDDTTQNNKPLTPEEQKARYRPASKEALAFRDATNVNAEKIVNAAAGDGQPNRQSKVLVKDSRDYIIEHEGLMVGDEKRRQLSQQWWFALSSEPLQRGLDAGLILGAVTAGGLVGFKKQYRSQPVKVAFFSVMAFCVGCMSVPLSVIYLDTKNAEKIRARERASQQEARDEYLNRRG